MQSSEEKIPSISGRNPNGYVSKIILCLVIVVAVALRASCLECVSGYDEIGAISTIIEAREQGMQDLYKSLALKAANIPNSTWIIDAFIANIDFVIVPIRWTYAISLYPLIAATIQETDDYSILKLKGLIPFVLLNCIGYMLLVTLVQKIYKTINFTIFFALITGLGIEFVYWSRTATPYSLLTIGYAVQLLVLYNINKQYKLGALSSLANRYLVAYGVWLSVPTILNYQFALTMPGLVLVCALLFKNATLSTKQSLLLTLPSILVAAGSFLFITARGRLTGKHINPGVNSLSSGQSGEYVFSNHSGSLSEIIKYYLNNSAEIAGYILNPIQISKNAVIAIGSITLIALFLAFIHSAGSKAARKGPDIYLVYSISIILVFYSLVPLGLMTLSPTRHTLFLAVPLLMLIGSRVAAFVTTSRSNKFGSIILGILSIGITFYNFESYFKDPDPTDPLRIISIAKNVNPDFLMAGPCVQAPMMIHQLKVQYVLSYKCGEIAFNRPKAKSGKFLFYTDYRLSQTDEMKYIRGFFASDVEIVLTEEIKELDAAVPSLGNNVVYKVYAFANN